jgi:2-amino-4-hydroxy-6-hydroxymethyldihydropteridine diphosphokinase
MGGGGYDVCIGLGTNTGNTEKNLIEALNSIKDEASNAASPLYRATLAGSSNIYLSSPVENTNQPYFLNCAVLLRMPSMPPYSCEGQSCFGKGLLSVFKRIEKKMGRKIESERYMPRIIDIDMLFVYDNGADKFITLNLPELKLPHSEIFKRKFVLYPVLDLSCGFQNPFDEDGIKKALAELENSDAGAFQKISYYGKLAENLTRILR